MVKVRHPYKFRAFRTLIHLLYIEAPYIERDGSRVHITSISQFTLKLHLVNSKYVREDLRILEQLGFLSELDLGHNKATCTVRRPLL